MYYVLNFKKEEFHVHAFVWIFDALRISDETEYKSFVERTISAIVVYLS